MILPTVHLNGTSRDSLVEQRTDVLQKLREAAEALAQMAPNERDYYVQADPNAFREARKLHDARRKMLGDLYAEVEAEAIALSDA